MDLRSAGTEVASDGWLFAVSQAMWSRRVAAWNSLMVRTTPRLLSPAACDG